MTGHDATPSARVPGPAARGTLFQRARAASIRVGAVVLDRLPAELVGALCDAVGELWYRGDPKRADIARANLAHVVSWLTADGRGGARVQAAATDADALERMVRAAFRNAARSYGETFRMARTAREAIGHLRFDTPETIDSAFDGGGAAVFASLHFGSMAASGAVMAERSRVPVTTPMETLGDPELQRVIREARATSGMRIVGLSEARRELRAALARGEAAGIVADRDITGGGMRVSLFGLPAMLPIGPPYLALESGAPLHVAAVRRVRGGYRGRLITLAHPSPELPRRARVEALLAAEAAAFEELIAAAPAQWWAVFYPIWDDVPPLPRAGAAVALARGSLT